MNLPPDELIARHIQKLTSRAGAEEKVRQVLDRCALSQVGDRVTSRHGALTPRDCESYKHAVKEVFGDAVYSFAKVNFVLGGCTCRDCAARA